MRRRLRIAADAVGDLTELSDYLDARAGAEIAERYLRRLEDQFQRLTEMPYVGMMRDDVRPGLRTLRFGRRVTLLFEVRADAVRILRVLYGGRDLDRAFRRLD